MFSSDTGLRRTSRQVSWDSDAGRQLRRELRSVSDLKPDSRSNLGSLVWAVTVSTAICMAILNFVTIMAVHRLVDWKWTQMQDKIREYGVFTGICWLTFVCATFATVCTLIVHIISPSAGGSGAPENKCWLNGTKSMRSMFTSTNLLVRAIAVILANATGYPVGREGPTVTMGSNVAYLIVDCIFSRFGLARSPEHSTLVGRRDSTASSIDLQLPHGRSTMSIDPGDHVESPSAFVSLEETQMTHAQRMAGSVGGACAMAMIFDAPIGGVLYMFEEITVFSWPLQLTFRAFVGTMLCCLVSHFLINLLGLEVKHFVLWDFNAAEDVWHWADVPFFALLSWGLGRFSVLHTRLALKSGQLRQQMHARLPDSWTVRVPFSRHPLPVAKMVEAVVFAVVTVLLYCICAMMGECNSKYKSNDVVAGQWVIFNCEDGAFNPVASLLLTTSEGAVRRLFSQQHTGYMGPLNIMLAFVPYTAMNIALTGIPVPSGNFTGTLLIGAFVGRLMGSVVHGWSPGLTQINELMPDNFKVYFAVPGIYAMIGAAAMLSGFKQISMGVVVFIVEAANNLSLTPPLMLAVSISLLINKSHLKSGFDEEQIARKNIPFLHAEPPPGLVNYTAAFVMEPPEVVVPIGANSDTAKRIIRHVTEQNMSGALDKIFPVVEDGPGGIRTCHGFTTCKRLIQSLNEADEIGDEFAFQGESSRWIDFLAYTIPGGALASKFYPLFSKLRAEVVCVVDNRGNFEGMITRDRIIYFAKLAEEDAETDLSDSDGE